MPESGTTPAPRDRIAAIKVIADSLTKGNFFGWLLANGNSAIWASTTPEEQMAKVAVDALIDAAFLVLAAEPTTALTEEQHNIMASRGYDPNRPGEYEQFIADGETFEWREQAGSEHEAALAPEPADPMDGITAGDPRWAVSPDEPKPAGAATHNTPTRELAKAWDEGFMATYDHAYNDGSVYRHQNPYGPASDEAAALDQQILAMTHENRGICFCGIVHAPAVPGDVDFADGVSDTVSRDDLIELLNSAQHAPMDTHDGRTGECLQCPWPLHELGPEEIADAVLALLVPTSKPGGDS